MDTEEHKEVVLSGIRATGKLHIGNYVGAVKQFVEYSNNPNYNCYFFVANLHTLTTHFDPEEVRSHLIDIVRTFIACGIDPATSVIYAQSSVPETSELAWLLNCLASVPTLERMKNYQEKAGKLNAVGNRPSAGLLTYPCLMASDILGIRSTVVPVGEDQLPHIELTKELAAKFNKNYGDLFPIPRVSLSSNGMKAPSLSGSGKMGKSDDSGVLSLTASDENILQSFKSAVTDSRRQRRTDPGNPGDCNLYTYHQIFSTPEEIRWALNGCQKAEIGCLECKIAVARHVQERIEPIREKYEELLKLGDDYILDILHNGGLKTRAIVAETVAKAKELMGVPFF